MKSRRKIAQDSSFSAEKFRACVVCGIGGKFVGRLGRKINNFCPARLPEPNPRLPPAGAGQIFQTEARIFGDNPLKLA